MILSSLTWNVAYFCVSLHSLEIGFPCHRKLFLGRMVLMWLFEKLTIFYYCKSSTDNLCFINLYKMFVLIGVKPNTFSSMTCISGSLSGYEVLGDEWLAVRGDF